VAWNDQVDFYCERLEPGLWGEPTNALSNISFLLAAIALWRILKHLRAHGRTVPGDVQLLIPLVLLVGIGSVVFHTLATRWAALLDTLFILIFCCAFLFAFLRQAADQTFSIALAVSVGFALLSFGFPLLFPREMLNGSLGYVPYLIALLTMTGYLASRGAPSTRTFGVAVIVFCISLTLRTVDLDLCPRFPLGTHFVWHLLNGYLLWLVSREMILGRIAPQEK
jgi:ceramidase